MKVYVVDLPFYALFCLFSLFCSCIARYAPLKNEKTFMFREINLDSYHSVAVQTL
jgi:hypothetical protein